jgi:hypothetical protein
MRVSHYRFGEQKGKLPAVKFGKSWRISSKKLEDLFEK